jgi:hypothetical protein
MFTICDARMHADGVIRTPQNHATKPPNKIAARFRGDPGSLRDFVRTPDRRGISWGPRIAARLRRDPGSSSSAKGVLWPLRPPWPDGHPHRHVRQPTSLAGG